ncbi:MAG TPA: 23S rRNA (guanosine(2251)-2'-O)-methyltransferase RlmB [Porphyromonadaceae bacterium]|jgi:23S rRNA (guanosine2251-2'-O)-methyltransferase|uniref:23S rRNA (guanosine(2251)-2'-O)-methyltransferase RlmB n=1 Tax=Petrimonas sp. TaxID=2023866 RepID=UPI000EDA9A7F|nr:23S rRNA (guanosine(2251)-2'-O)-methyltransferase RlmB [Petrimonas sp.]NLU29814.1 23S rRNA (guanosine(2251)-2'-O)-methyltransferase RlmB [Bacteroidales bacterium]BBD46366.1 RNA methyltransferase, TrmH family, group 3 [Petrimonas sp. IBARAKI]HCB89296.1 23S rRNA (guanosine(2251)-2'-O)-methyltransferase RlmB [Porphyromonadaceae bacterium]HOI79473.1 23S rRNA (guanosine(2251)-2'-O)-methyltransferase RlmB [Petrimonas sp.]
MKEKEMIFGIRAVIEAAEAGKDIDKVLVKRELSGELFKELQEVLRRCEIPMQKVPLERIDRITRKNHQGVIAFTSAVTYQKLDQIVPFLYEQGKNPLIVVLDGITDVRNFGAIARTCEVAGVDAIVIPARGSVSVNADAIKTSAGALHIIPVCRENSLKDAVVFLKNSGIRVVAATEKAAKNYTVADMSVPVAILMGSEDEGVSPEILRVCDELVKVPQFGSIQSLNVSVAAGVMIYEVVRQRSIDY